jgi:single-stranded DNA-specific DHH superfamily exonuclease
VGYYDDPALSPFAQFRLRRNQGYEAIDLREAIAKLGMTNGGGHPGAVGFRVEREALPDIRAAARGYAAALAAAIDAGNLDGLSEPTHSGPH